MRFFIVEDDLLFRDLFRIACRDYLKDAGVGEAGKGREAVAMVREATPDLVLLDLVLPDMDGFEALRQMRESVPALKAIIITSYCNAFTVYQAELAVVQGFLDKGASTFRELSEALAAVKAGRTYFSRQYLEIQKARQADSRAFDKVLSPREQTILALIAHPMTDREIAVQLELSPDTVEKHRFNIMRKLGLPSTQALGRYARLHGFNLNWSAVEAQLPPATMEDGSKTV